MDDQGKRVAWVELYLDLVFVLAVAQLAHLIEAEPVMRGDLERYLGASRGAGSPALPSRSRRGP